MNTRNHIILLVLLLVLMGIFHAYEKRRPEAKQAKDIKFRESTEEAWKSGKQVPGFETVMLTGEHFKLSDRIGKEIIMIYFTATWCGPCKKMVPEIKHLMEGYKDKPFSMISLFLAGEDQKQEVEEAVQKYGNPYSSHSALATKDLTKLYDVKGVPTFIIIDKDGKCVFYQTGGVRNVDVTLKPVIDAQIERFSDSKGIEIELKIGGGE